MVISRSTGVGVLDAGGDCRRGMGSLGVNLGRPLVISGAFATLSSQITLRTCSTIGLSHETTAAGADEIDYCVSGNVRGDPSGGRSADSGVPGM